MLESVLPPIVIVYMSLYMYMICHCLSCIIISRNIINNNGYNRPICHTPTVVGKSLTIFDILYSLL